MKKHRVNVLLVASVLLSLGAQVGAAQSGVIAFFDTCDNRPYVMRGDGTGRIRLADAYATPWDISRGGWPMTVVTHELFAVEVSDIAGQLEVGPLVSLEPEGGVGWTETPAISLVVDRIAYMTPGSTSFYPMTIWVADLVRSSSGRIAAATNHRVLARWDEIGSPSDLVEGPVQSGLGGIAFSPDGRSLLVEVYGDLWLLHLAGDGSLLAKQRVTQTRERVEWGARSLPTAGSLPSLHLT